MTEEIPTQPAQDAGDYIPLPYGSVQLLREKAKAGTLTTEELKHAINHMRQGRTLASMKSAKPVKPPKAPKAVKVKKAKSMEVVDEPTDDLLKDL